MAANARESTRILLLQASVIVYSLTAAAFHSDRPSIGDDPWGLLRLAIPAVAAMCGLLLRDAYASVDRPPHAAALDVIVAALFAVVSQMALSLIKPELVLPRWAPTQGGFVGLMLLVATRALFPAVVGMSPVDLRKMRRGYLAAATVFGSLGLLLAFNSGARVRVAACLLFMGSGYLFYQVLKRSGMRLDHAAYWYYGSLLPAFAVLLWGSPVYPYWVLPAILIAAELNHRAAVRAAPELTLTP